MRGSCKCSCRHTTPFKYAAAAVQLLSHPFLPRPQIHPVCGCSDVLSHPLVYHTPLGPPASCTLSPGVHKISHSPQDTTPGDNIFKSQNFITGVCYLVSVTVGQFREFESPRVHTRNNSWRLFLVHKLTCGKRESMS